jgi:bacterioferritin-associated ferredoxin
MIVCICRAVSDRVIRSTIAAGASSVTEVGKACRAGTCCGACHSSIARLLEDAEAPSGPCDQQGGATGDRRAA